MTTFRSSLAWPFNALTIGCVIAGVVCMVVARFLDEGLQGRTVRQFLHEVML